MYCLMVMFCHVILWIHYYSWYFVLNFVNSIKQELGGRHGHDRMVVRTTTTYTINAYHNWCEFESWSERGVQHYVIKFVSDLRQVGGFLWVLRFRLKNYYATDAVEFILQSDHNNKIKRINLCHTTHVVPLYLLHTMIISVISWRSVLLVEETGGPRENHRAVASHWQTLSHNVVHLALIKIRTHISCDVVWHNLILFILLLWSDCRINSTASVA
jgi:hypothetical protein